MRCAKSRDLLSYRLTSPTRHGNQGMSQPNAASHASRINKPDDKDRDQETCEQKSQHKDALPMRNIPLGPMFCRSIFLILGEVGHRLLSRILSAFSASSTQPHPVQPFFLMANKFSESLPSTSLPAPEPRPDHYGPVSRGGSRPAPRLEAAPTLIAIPGRGGEVSGPTSPWAIRLPSSSNQGEFRCSIAAPFSKPAQPSFL